MTSPASLPRALAWRDRAKAMLTRATDAANSDPHLAKLARMERAKLRLAEAEERVSLELKNNP